MLFFFFVQLFGNIFNHATLVVQHAYLKCFIQHKTFIYMDYKNLYNRFKIYKIYIIMRKIKNFKTYNLKTNDRTKE